EGERALSRVLPQNSVGLRAAIHLGVLYRLRSACCHFRPICGGTNVHCSHQCDDSSGEISAAGVGTVRWALAHSGRSVAAGLMRSSTMAGSAIESVSFQAVALFPHDKGNLLN